MGDRNKYVEHAPVTRHISHRDAAPLEAQPVSVDDFELYQRVYRLLSGKWKKEILWNLSYGELRFGELKRRLPGITHHMLTLRLRELEHAGMVKRTAFDEAPIRVQYEITQAAIRLRPMLRAMLDWGRRHESLLPPLDH